MLGIYPTPDQVPKLERDMLKLLKTTIAGGLIFLLPVAILGFILGKIVVTAEKLAEPISDKLPVSSFAGVSATIGPMLGMNASRPAIRPRAKANGTPASQRPRAVNEPTADMAISWATSQLRKVPADARRTSSPRARIGERRPP